MHIGKIDTGFHLKEVLTRNFAYIHTQALPHGDIFAETIGDRFGDEEGPSAIDKTGVAADLVVEIVKDIDAAFDEANKLFVGVVLAYDGRRRARP